MRRLSPVQCRAGCSLLCARSEKAIARRLSVTPPNILVIVTLPPSVVKMEIFWRFS